MTIRDALESAVNTVEEAKTPAPETPAVTPVVETPVATPVAAETEEQRVGRTAGRPRDEHGRLLPGKPEKPVVPAAAPVVAAAPAEPAKPHVPPPSSWKKDHWESWNKIAAENPQLADYLTQREGEFAKGVSTYKQEYEMVRPLAEAVQPFLPDFQRYGVQPHEYISNVLGISRTLAMGSHQDKIQVVQNILANNGIQAQLAVQDPQGQWQLLGQPQRQQQSPPAPQPDVKALVQEQLTEVFAKQDLEQFQAAKDGSGNPLYPHYGTVRNTMAQLLESGAAQDLKSAYDKAIRLHDDIWEADQATKQAATLKATQAAQAKQVAQAKAAAVSPRTTTPGAETPKATKGIRAAIESAVDAHSAEGGRV